MKPSFSAYAQHQTIHRRVDVLLTGAGAGSAARAGVGAEPPWDLAIGLAKMLVFLATFTGWVLDVGS